MYSVIHATTRVDAEDIIITLLEREFLHHCDDEQKQILVKGRPTPEIPNLYDTVEKNGNTFVRTFKSTSYVKVEWLCGSAKLNKLFCWPCLLYSKDADRNRAFCRGFTDILRLMSAVVTHEKSQIHKAKMAMYKSDVKEKVENIPVVKPISVLDLQKEKDDIIVCLLENDYISSSAEEKLHTLKLGRPTPDLPNLCSTIQRKNNTIIKKYEYENYEKTKWLAGSAQLNKLFCWPCLLYSKDHERNRSFCKGYDDILNLEEALSIHEKTIMHKDKMTLYQSDIEKESIES